MVPNGLGRTGGGSAKKDDLALPIKPSGLDQVLKLIHPRTSKLSKAKLRIAPSGAIVFAPVQSQESLGFSTLPAEIPAVQPTDSSTTRPHSTPVSNQRIPGIASSLRSSSFESVRTLQSSVPRTRTTEYERQRRYNFLGRHPPPIQRRSASLPRILENQPPTQSSPRQGLFLGGPTNRPRPGYTKIPRFVPLEIRLNLSVAMENSPACAVCDQAHDAEGLEVVQCNDCGQRFSLDSSRSTRGGSEVPTLKINLLDEKGALPMSDSKGVLQAVGNKFKSVFGKGKENQGHNIEKAASKDARG